MLRHEGEREQVGERHERDGRRLCDSGEAFQIDGHQHGLSYGEDNDRANPVCYLVQCVTNSIPSHSKWLGRQATGRGGLSIGHQRLIALASRGDVDAFAKLVREHSDLVEATAIRILGKNDAQDASQEVWVRVWRDIRSFRGESSFSTWLYRITVNTCLSARKKELRRTTREYGDEISYLAESLGGEADPEAVALNAERREEIEAALVLVRAEHRAALVLRHMEGLSYAEIAEVLEIPSGTAKGWVSRGRAAMLVALAAAEGKHCKEVNSILVPVGV